MRIWRLKIEWGLGRVIGGIGPLNEAVVDLQRRVNDLEKHQVRVKERTVKEEETENEIEEILSKSHSRFYPKGDTIPEGDLV